jgi:hypothetical protein
MRASKFERGTHSPNFSPAQIITRIPGDDLSRFHTAAPQSGMYAALR